MKLHTLTLSLSTAALLAACGGDANTAKDMAKDTVKKAKTAATAEGGDIRIVGSSTVSKRNQSLTSAVITV